MANSYLRADSAHANPTLQTAHRSVLLREIRSVCDRHGIAPSRFGRDACNDPALITNLHNGRDPGAAVRAKIAGHIAALCSLNAMEA